MPTRAVQAVLDEVPVGVRHVHRDVLDPDRMPEALPGPLQPGGEHREGGRNPAPRDVEDSAVVEVAHDGDVL